MKRHYPSIDYSASPKLSPSALNTSLPTMPNAKRQKLDRSTTAAYAASQPLYDVVKKAHDTLPEQGIGLRAAADITRQIHVGLQMQDGTNNIEKHIKYMDSLVESWRLVTDAYCDIFTQLTLVTAEKPAEGKPAAKAHDDFTKILEAAQAAQRTAREYVTLKEKPGMAKAEPVHVSSKDELSKKPQPTSSAPATPTPSARKPAKGTKYDKSGLKILWKDGKLRVPLAELSKAEKKEWYTVERLNKRQQQKGKVAAIKNEHEQKLNGGTSVSNGVSEASSKAEQQVNISMPDAEFEDDEAVSAEVEARLKAKAESKKAKKAHKKRKRDSIESFVNGDDAVESVPAGGSKASEKPSKKKLKNESGEVMKVDSGIANGDKAEKHKNGDAASDFIKASKKRKKNKTKD